MKRNLAVLALLIGVIGACAPVATVTPTEQVANLPFDEASSRVMSAINSQPYPENTGGWVITNSDQVGGFVSAELNGSSFILFQGNVPYRAVVSVSLVARSENTTAVNISGNRQEQSLLLMDNIRAALDLN